VRRPSALWSGIATGLSSALVAIAAAAAAVILLQKFGRGASTDGLLAAYNVYLVLAIVASGGRFVSLPDLTRAHERGELDRELRSYALALSAIMLPLLVLTPLLADEIGRLLIAGGQAQHLAAETLPWFVGAGFLQILAGIEASALAVLGDYMKAAIAYSAGAVVNLAVFALLVDSHGVIAIAWGSFANGVVVVLPLGIVLARRGLIRLGSLSGVVSRLRRLVSSTALLLSLQLLYLISVRAASGLGTGQATSLAVAYLLASALVGATASSISLVSSAPLTRRSTDAGAAARHIVHSSWLSLAVVAAGIAGAAVAGEAVFSHLFGGTFGGRTGSQLGLLLVYLAPWMVATVAVALVYPLLFVLERAGILFPLSLAAPVVQVGAAYALREALGLRGVAFSLDLTTLIIVVVLVGALARRALGVVARGLAAAALVLGSIATAAFLPLAFALPRLLAAALGLCLYILCLIVVRPRGLRVAWAYMRALHD
jgi:peptidoglycan biosynthesis protein MviN/MurJ (putative lipid II flippase)